MSASAIARAVAKRRLRAAKMVAAFQHADPELFALPVVVAE